MLVFSRFSAKHYKNGDKWHSRPERKYCSPHFHEFMSLRVRHQEVWLHGEHIRMSINALKELAIKLFNNKSGI